MAYVSGCKHDVFVSYANVDNQRDPGVESGWVTSLVVTLRNHLAAWIGRTESFDIWWDRTDLSETDSLEQQIGNSLRNTATLVVILSRAYLASDWCKKECDFFLNAISNSGIPHGRIFLIDIGNLDLEDRPERFRDFVGFQFWKSDETNKRHTLGHPAPNPLQDRDYYSQVNHLAKKISERLEELNSATQNAAGLGSDIEGVQGGDSRPTVVLAEATDDLEFKRLAVVRYLEQQNINVVPQNVYPADFTLCGEAIDQDLQRGVVFAQLIGEYPGRKLVGSTTRLSHLQLERALANGHPVIQWRDPALDMGLLKESLDSAHFEFLDGDSVMATDLEVFKSEIYNLMQLKIAERATGRTRRADASVPFIYVNSSVEDRETAEELVSKLGALNCMSAPPLDSGDPKEIRSDLEENVLDCDGLILLYGRVSRKWIREQLRLVRKLFGRRDKRPALAVCDAPPDPKENLTIRFPELQLINCRNGLTDDPLRAFLRTVALE